MDSCALPDLISTPSYISTEACCYPKSIHFDVTYSQSKECWSVCENSLLLQLVLCCCYLICPEMVRFLPFWHVGLDCYISGKAKREEERLFDGFHLEVWIISFKMLIVCLVVYITWWLGLHLFITFYIRFLGTFILLTLFRFDWSFFVAIIYVEEWPEMVRLLPFDKWVGTVTSLVKKIERRKDFFDGFHLLVWISLCRCSSFAWSSESVMARATSVPHNCCNLHWDIHSLFIQLEKLISVAIVIFEFLSQWAFLTVFVCFIWVR